MPIVEAFNRVLTGDERRILREVNTPPKIQVFLAGLPYSRENGYRCPLRVLREMSSDGPLERIGERLDEIRRIPILTHRMIEGLSPVDQRSYQAGLLGADKTGLYRPLHKRDKKA